MSRMRVALLYSGLPRMWRECHASQIALFPDADVDVFCHFWDTIDAAEKDELLAALRPVAWRFDAPLDLTFVDRYANLELDVINIPSRMVSQYVSWRNVATLFAPYIPQYRISMRSRTDLYFFEPINFDLAKIWDREIGLVTWSWPEEPALLSDVCAIGLPRPIHYWHSLLDRLWIYAQATPFNPEHLISRHIVAFPGTLVGFTLPKWPFFVRRPHHAGWSVERCRSESPGASKWYVPEIVSAHKDYHRTILGSDADQHVEEFRRRAISISEAVNRAGVADK